MAAMARSIEQRGHHVTCALIGTSRKLAAYNYTTALVDANRGIQKVRVEPATRTTLEYELVDANGSAQMSERSE